MLANRPASIEHLDRLTASKMSSEQPPQWEGSGARKPLTLPPNLTPKFFQKSPREALRRVTSLLIRKGNNNGKEKENSRSKEATSPAARSANGEEHPGQKQRKGFFRSLWKKSRHYSLEHPWKKNSINVTKWAFVYVYWVIIMKQSYWPIFNDGDSRHRIQYIPWYIVLQYGNFKSLIPMICTKFIHTNTHLIL